MNEDITKWANVNEDIYWIEGQPWKLEAKILSPLAFPHTNIEVNRSELRKTIKKSGALVARWYKNWGKKNSNWWWICCNDKNLTIDTIKSSRGKRGVKKGLKLINVKRVSPTEFGERSYPIYKKSLISYGINETKIISKEEYYNEIIRKGSFDGCEFWGAFYNETLVAYSTCIIYSNAVSLGVTKSDPEYHKYNPNNALFFEITRYYLQEKKVDYVTNGVRTLLHTTSINEFLSTMNYSKIYCDLHIELSFQAKIVYWSRIADWGKMFFLHKLMPSKWRMLSGFSLLIKYSV